MLCTLLCQNQCSAPNFLFKFGHWANLPLLNLRKKIPRKFFRWYFSRQEVKKRKIRSLFLYVEETNEELVFAYREKNQTFLERKFLTQTYLLGNAVSFTSISLNHQVSLRFFFQKKKVSLRLLGRWLSFSTLPEEEFPSKWREEEESRSSKAL